MTDRHRPSPGDRYRLLWASGPAPDLDLFRAGLQDPTAEELLDVIEIDRAERWRRHERVTSERYLRDFPTIGTDAESALVVIYGEYYLRKELGEEPSLPEYLARFPQYEQRLRDQVMWHEAIELDAGLSLAKVPEIPGLAIAELLGRGGMSSVYRAVDTATGSEVAVKLLDRDTLHHPLRVARFRREVNSLMRLRHPHIVTAVHTDEFHGLPYLVMEYCSGGSLAGHLRGRPLTPGRTAGTLRAVAAAVAYAHGQGVIHRDLKPGNILLALSAKRVGDTPSAVPKVSDFGLAKCQVDVGANLTATRETLGTPCYMAPELTTGARDADERTDVYGLGAVLYELLTGRPPFVGTIPLEVIRMVREEKPVAPSLLNRDVPAELESVCLQCLEKEPDRRPATAAEVSDAMRRFQRHARGEKV